MRIEDGFSPSNNVRSHSVERTPETRQDRRTEGRHPDSSSDSASLSALSVELSRAVEQDPQEVVARIARLQEAVANGTYSVPDSEVSARIVSAGLSADF